VAASAVVSGPAAILDVDGTLVDSNYQHAVAWYRAFRQHGHVLPLWRVHRHIGMGSDQLVASLCGEAVEEQQGDDIRAAEKALYFAMIEEVEPLDLVEAALERVGGGGDDRRLHVGLPRGEARRRRDARGAHRRLLRGGAARGRRVRGLPLHRGPAQALVRHTAGVGRQA
jgi:beta-phosphoglucomutase-like phosphatase (HAD superfamily)